MIKKERSTKGLARVTFELPATTRAARINLVGEFNGWDTTATPMSRNHAGANWRATLDLEAGLRYRFRYLVDGRQWLNDWHADDFVENPYGSYDSVLDLTEFDEWPLPALNVEQALAKDSVTR
jgi:1,4-alpha-glucan branching enzyme